MRASVGSWAERGFTAAIAAAAAACAVTPAPAPAPVYVQAGPGAGAVAVAAGPTGPIEAGCSYNGTQLPGQIGDAFQVACPANCAGTTGLWGTDVYTADSGICHAATHAGLISPAGGVVTVQLQPGRPAYRGSMRNGVRSNDYGEYRQSYVFVGAAPQPPPPGGPSAQLIEAGCSFNATQITDAPGTAHLVSCPPGCAGIAGLWGTDVYTGDSGICHAAIHAGLLSNDGGTVRVILELGRPAYRGSVRNGLTSNDYGSYRSSFRLAPP